MRPPPRPVREDAPRNRARSASPDRHRKTLRERDVNLQAAPGTATTGESTILTFRPKPNATAAENTQAYLEAARTHATNQGIPDLTTCETFTASEIANLVSDADDITINTFNVSFANDFVGPAFEREACELTRRNPTSSRTAADYLAHRANIDAISTYWDGCPSKVLPPYLIPKHIPSPTAPPGKGKTGPVDPMEWDPVLVKGLRLLAELCTAKEAGHWLREELHEQRKNDDADLDAMTKFTVHKVYTKFLQRGYKPKTLAKAQQDNKAKNAALSASVRLHGADAVALARATGGNPMVKLSPQAQFKAGLPIDTYTKSFSAYDSFVRGKQHNIPSSQMQFHDGLPMDTYIKNVSQYGIAGDAKQDRTPRPQPQFHQGLPMDTYIRNVSQYGAATGGKSGSTSQMYGGYSASPSFTLHSGPATYTPPRAYGGYNVMGNRYNPTDARKPGGARGY